MAEQLLTKPEAVAALKAAAREYGGRLMVAMITGQLGVALPLTEAILAVAAADEVRWADGPSEYDLAVVKGGLTVYLSAPSPWRSET